MKYSIKCLIHLFTFLYIKEFEYVFIFIAFKEKKRASQ